MTGARVGASFRDPAGFVYTAGGALYRQVNRCYEPHYNAFISSGLYDALVANRLLVRHTEVPPHGPASAEVARVLAPERIPYVSYPYEWCFSQLKDAALLTLEIQLLSLSHGMTLKDASAFNVQFVGSRPIFIDTLSFEPYREGTPWVAYRQFCQHFVAPLALVSHVDGRLGQLFRTWLDGVPLDLASRLLPASTRLRPGLLLHVHAHARSQARHQDDARAGHAIRTPSLPKHRLLALLGSLRSAVTGCAPPRRRTEWGDYYDATSYSPESMSAKEALVQRMAARFASASDVIHDLGSNTGRFSRLLASAGAYVVSHDLDPLAVERNYTYNRSHGIEGVLPLLLDVTNPSPPAGWALRERTSAMDRVSGSTVVALALVHHLAISNNVPLSHLAEFFASLANTLIVEFVPKEDPQVQRLLATREDVFPDYTRERFEEAFAAHFHLRAAEGVAGTPRILFAMQRLR